jgi:glycerophosphoryl diester phosphodiesterase
MSGSPLIIAHRGASRHAPENTLTAIAWQLNWCGRHRDRPAACKGWRARCIHDADLLRTGGISKKVRDMASAEMARVDVGFLVRS